MIPLKQNFFASKGVYASWDRLGDISASVDLLQNVRKQVLRALKTTYHGITHIDPDTSAAINKIASKVGELELHTIKSDRAENELIKPIIDTLAVGEKKLKSSTLATFNRKAKGMMAGNGFDAEVDEIPGLPVDFNGASDEPEDSLNNHTK